VCVPFHSAGPYISKLIESGENVAICEQVEDPRTAKGIVRREVVRVVTPGLVVDGDNLSPKENNYLLSLTCDGGATWGFSCLDLSTGEFKVTELKGIDAVVTETACLNPREILLPLAFRDNGRMRELGPVAAERIVSFNEDWIYDRDYCCRLITAHFGVASLDAVGCQQLQEGSICSGGDSSLSPPDPEGESGHITDIVHYATHDSWSSTKRHAGIWS